MAASRLGKTAGETLMETKKNAMIVAAIDFGTTYSGCAYSFRKEWEQDPLKILSKNFITRPDSDGRDSTEASPYQSITQRQTEKVPTTILFNDKKEFVAFGYEAENTYAVMCEDDKKKAKTWYYFSQFKMNLHSKPVLTRETELLDFTQKKKLPAIKVFSEAIRYLRNNVLQASPHIRQEDVEWVLTVPAIWTDKARQFMREAARLAGIPDERLSLALEPEAASVLCLEEDRRQGHLGICQPGSRFMVVDNGGGTVDITVYEVVKPKTVASRYDKQTAAVRGVLKELHRPTGGPCAGTQVDKGFKKFLSDISSFEAIASLEKLETLEIDREFEEVKKMLDPQEYFYLRLPPSAVDALKDALNDKGKEVKDKVSIIKNRMKIKRAAFEGFFDNAVEGVKEYMDTVLKKVGNVDKILLVGGFSSCLLLQNSLKDHYPGKQIIIPPDPAAAVLKGAVLFRHDPTVIGWRASAFTYGVEADEPFEEGRHRAEEAYVVDGVKRSRHVFASFIRIDDIVEVNKLAKSEVFQPCEDRQTRLVLPIFKSKREDPVHTTDEGCEKLGEVTVELKNVQNTKEEEIAVEMYVGGTELIVRARNEKTKEEYSTVCDFLCK